MTFWISQAALKCKNLFKKSWSDENAKKREKNLNLRGHQHTNLLVDLILIYISELIRSTGYHP